MPAGGPSFSGSGENTEIERNRTLDLESLANLKHFFAAIVTTVWADAMGAFGLATMGATTGGGPGQSVVGATPVAAGFGMSSFWMGHGI